MSKMGISTVQSYHGAQIFEAVGLQPGRHRQVLHRTASRIGGIGLDVIAAGGPAAPPRGLPRARGRAARRSTPAASTSGAATASTTSSTPRPIHQLQNAVRTGSFDDLQGVRAADRRSEPQHLCTLRGLLEFKCRRAGAARGGRAGRGDRQALQDRRHVATARSARRRTRRWPSP